MSSPSRERKSFKIGEALVLLKFHKVPPCFRSMGGSLQSLVHVRYGNLQ
jgi:hypothetical protein